MGMWIAIAIVLFVLGSMMALKPSGIDQRLDKLRMTARRLQLNPKLVTCPDWVKGRDNEYGRGMIGQYGLVLDNVKLPLTRYQVLDGQWRPAGKIQFINGRWMRDNIPLQTYNIIKDKYGNYWHYSNKTRTIMSVTDKAAADTMYNSRVSKSTPSASYSATIN